MKKKDELDNPNSCLNKSRDDEPVFVLCARDVNAADTVRFWADLARKSGVNEAKVREAESLANSMTEWPTKKVPD